MGLTIAGFLVLFVLVFLGLPIAFAMLLVGLGGFSVVVGAKAASVMIGQVAFDTVMNYEFSVLPLFILMGNFISQSGLSEDLYTAGNAWIGHRRGGLAMATIMACGGFSAVSGSSLATAATMAKVAGPPMRRFGYADTLVTGSIAAGGTLGILIPPSVILVLYGIITETEIGKLFAAGVIPGLVGVLFYMAAIWVVTWRDPSLGPPGERVGYGARFRALRKVWGVLFLFAIVMGGIYFGICTPTEAAGIGAAGAFLFALSRGRLGARSVLAILIDSGKTTTMMFFVLIGAIVFANFIDVARTPVLLEAWIEGLNVPPMAVMFVILAVYVVLGCILESVSMMLLTVPLFFPIVTGLGFDPIWFGVIVVVVIEISLITPPIGLNVFVLSAMMPDVSAGTVFRGVAPFIVSDIVRLALLVFVPSLVLFLPSLMR
jgi:C4-dicarboxylate transporter DctM subunit